jgi:transposase-like protein
MRNKYGIVIEGPLRAQVVRDVESKRLSLQEAIEKYGVSSSAIRSWVKIARSEGYAELYFHQRRTGLLRDMGRPKKKTLEQMTELERLKYENEMLRIENALLKKVKALVEEREARLRAIGHKPSKD